MRRKNLSFVAGICILIGLVSTGLLMSIHGSIAPIPQEISPNLPVVALTFDDGPNARFTPEILDILYEQQVPATFFVVGDHLKGQAWLVRKIAASGHEIGNHTDTHPDLTTLDSAQILAEIQSTQEKLQKILPDYTVKFLRPPYGRQNEGVCQVSPLPLVLWNVDSGDWENPQAQTIYTTVMENIRDGDIIVFHDDNPETVKALEQILPALKARGYQFATVSTLLDLKKGQDNFVKE